LNLNWQEQANSKSRIFYTIWTVHLTERWLRTKPLFNENRIEQSVHQSPWSIVQRNWNFVKRYYRLLRNASLAEKN
jgi:hypothetical protein